MADSIKKILSIVCFLVLVSQGYSQCFLKDISVRQDSTGLKVQGKPEWLVAITNNCPCVQTRVELNCSGFQTVEPIDPSDLSLLGYACLVNDGGPIDQDAVTFKYAWDEQFPLNPVSSEISC